MTRLLAGERPTKQRPRPLTAAPGARPIRSDLMSQAEPSRTELRTWRDVDQGINDVARALGVGSPTDAALQRAMDEVGFPTLDELALMGEHEL